MAKGKGETKIEKYTSLEKAKNKVTYSKPLHRDFRQKGGAVFKKDKVDKEMLLKHIFGRRLPKHDTLLLETANSTQSSTESPVLRLKGGASFKKNKGNFDIRSYFG